MDQLGTAAFWSPAAPPPTPSRCRCRSPSGSRSDAKPVEPTPTAAPTQEPIKNPVVPPPVTVTVTAAPAPVAPVAPRPRPPLPSSRPRRSPVAGTALLAAAQLVAAPPTSAAAAEPKSDATWIWWLGGGLLLAAALTLLVPAGDSADLDEGPRMNQQTRVRRTAALAAGALASTTPGHRRAGSRPRHPRRPRPSPARSTGRSPSSSTTTSRPTSSPTASPRTPTVCSASRPCRPRWTRRAASAPCSTTARVKGSFVNAGSPFYWVKIEDPAVSVAADGEGADHRCGLRLEHRRHGFDRSRPPRPPGSWSPPSMRPARGRPARSPRPRTGQASCPRDAGSVALGIGAGKPVDGKSFAPAFLAQITSGVRAHFYASGAGSDAKKAPSAFTASFVARPRSAAP